jgi:hypothetical protein
MEDNHHPTSNSRRGLTASITSFISRVCHIPPKPRTPSQTWLKLERISHLTWKQVTGIAVFSLIVAFVLILAVNVRLLIPDYPIEGTLRNPHTIWTGHINIESDIVVNETSTLVIDGVTIRLQDTASLTMINCTNVGYSWTIQTNDYWEWPSGRSGGGRYRRPEGIIEVQDNATVWIEGTTVGRLIGTQYAVEGGIRPGYCAAATLIDSRIHEVRIRGQTPIRIIDSAVHELYADTGDVEQLGTTAVTYQLPFLQHDEWFHDCGRGPDIAYRSSIRVEKPAYQWGEPIRMTVFIENLGFQPFTLDFNGSDSFYITIYNTTSTYHVVYEYHPDQSMIPPKRVIEPGEVAAFTLTWRQDPPVAPGQYTVRCSEDLNTLQAWFSAGGTSFIVTNEPYAGD